MPVKKEAPLHQLQEFLPPGTLDRVLQFLQIYRIHLTITRHRKSILGDYRHRTQLQNHRISINGNLNRFAFLVTLIHEIAHLLTFEKFGNTVDAHGKEWKNIYAGLLKQFLGQNIFPRDIEQELLFSLRNPAASSCAEDGLLRAFRKYNDQTDGFKLVEEIAADGLFKLEDGKVYRKGEKQRKR